MRKDSSEKIFVLTDYRINSEQGAAFERLRCYALATPHFQWAMVIHDLDYKVSPKSTHSIRIENADFHVEVSGRRTSKFYQIFGKYFDFINPWKTISDLIRIKSDSQIILIYTSNFYLLLWSLIRLKWWRKCDLIIEKNEMEFSIVLNQFSCKSVTNFFLSISILPFRLLLSTLTDFLALMGSKVISISSSIHQIYKVKSIHIPILVDLNRFNESVLDRRSGAPRGVYIGEITTKKDGLHELVELAAKSQSQFHLDIIGNGTHTNCSNLQDKITRLGQQGRIKILPGISAKEIEQILSDYDFAILLRKPNFQTNYGFSTKLGEYLAADLLVFYTDVSDNCLYLAGSNNVLLDMKNIVLSAEKWDEAIENLTINGRDLGRTREIAKNYFDCRKYSKELNQIFS